MQEIQENLQDNNLRNAFSLIKKLKMEFKSQLNLCMSKDNKDYLEIQKKLKLHERNYWKSYYVIHQ